MPIVRDVPLARALVELEVGDAIPEALYEAVAEILRELWQRSARQAPGEPSSTRAHCTAGLRTLGLSAADGQVLAGQVADDRVAAGDVDVVLDADAAEGRERVDDLPVDQRPSAPARSGASSVVDEVDARLDREDLAGRDVGRVAQERVVRAGPAAARSPTSCVWSPSECPRPCG